MKRVFLAFLAILATSTAHADESWFYNQMYQDGRLDVTIALSFEQMKPDIPDTGVGHFFGTIWQSLNGVKRDLPNTLGDVAAIDKALLGCAECRFKAAGSGKGFRLYTAEFPFNGKPVKTTVKLIYSEPGVQISGLKSQFIQALGNDDVILYLGHSRHGGGIPDFASPIADTGKIFYNDPVTGWNGFNKGYFSKTKYQILSLNACLTYKYFKDAFRQNVWEKDPSRLALLLTNANTYFDDYPDTSVALIRGLMLQLPKAAIMASLETAAQAYQGAQTEDAAALTSEQTDAEPKPIPPLFTADGLFDNAYAGKPRPKRIEPREPLQSMPF